MKKEKSLFSLMSDIVNGINYREDIYKTIWYIENVGYMVTDGFRMLIAKEEEFTMCNKDSKLIEKLKNVYNNHKVAPVIFIPKNKSIHKCAD